MNMTETSHTLVKIIAICN